MRNLLLAGVLAVVLGRVVGGEEWECREDAGCIASHTVDGTVEVVTFRRGDLVSTASGWVVSADDGWVKVKTHGSRILMEFEASSVGSSFVGLRIGGAPTRANRWARPALFCLLP